MNPAPLPSPAPTWVLLRGLTREAAHWGSFPSVFQQTLPGAQLHLLDLPGNGARHAERSPATVDALVADVRAQIAQRDIATPVQVLALSLGAMVAAQWAHTAPHELAGAVLVNTSLRPFSPLHHRLQVSNWPRVLRLALGRPTPDAAERLVWQMTSRQRTVDEDVIATWVSARRQHPVRGANALRQLLAAARYRAPAQAPAVPLLLLAGAGDRLVDPRCSHALARAWQAPLREHPHAGHDLPLDDPHWLAQQVRDWLGQRA
ncbi:alpha/beta hydrolase [Hydrogenophaga sp.]|uniref:alpha/beta fold hydrolase n=1 Tax=Hydrogenophaga sp. TaxID=1904254 RepID=UPI00286E23C2|nr:alpha/beta hydrolase [Hydrogenophaga sp.]